MGSSFVLTIVVERARRAGCRIEPHRELRAGVPLQLQGRAEIVKLPPKQAKGIDIWQRVCSLATYVTRSQRLRFSEIIRLNGYFPFSKSVQRRLLQYVSQQIAGECEEGKKDTHKQRGSAAPSPRPFAPTLSPPQGTAPANLLPQYGGLRQESRRQAPI